MSEKKNSNGNESLPSEQIKSKSTKTKTNNKKRKKKEKKPLTGKQKVGKFFKWFFILLILAGLIGGG
ncbi:MAG TPA: hypothetical protein DHN33_00745, partial [Eubacteriaceae bacterium]|nr:hypothetical protein [Eubacteriaceae bacterium]